MNPDLPDLNQLAADRLGELKPFYLELIKQKNLKQELEQSQDNEDTLIGVFVCSLDGYFVGVSEVLCQLTGYTCAELKSLRWQDIIHADDLSAYALAVQQISDEEIIDENLHHRFICKNGQVVSIVLNLFLLRNSSGSPLHLICKFEDYTVNERLEELLAKSEQQYNWMFNSYPYPLWIYGVNTRMFQLVNDAAVLYYGYSQTEFLGMIVNDLYADRNCPIDCLLKSPRSPLRHQHIKQNGDLIDVEVRCHSLTYNNLPCHIVLVRDITERKQTEAAIAALKEVDENYRSIFENAVEGIFQTSDYGRYLKANPMLASIYGYDSPEELLESITDIATQIYVQPQRRLEFINLLKTEEAILGFESEVYCKDGSIIWISENVRAIRDHFGNLLRYEGSVQNISDRKLAEAKIEYLAFYDSLTDLPNRALFIDRLNHALALATRQNVGQSIGGFNTLLAVIFIDLDRFKYINDSYGHAVGDRLLQLVAQRFRQNMRQSDTVARLSGDEFMVLLPEIERAEDAIKVSEKLLKCLEQPFFVSNQYANYQYVDDQINQQEMYIGASIGISLYPNDGLNSDTLLKNADLAMYRAKEQGRNHYQLFAQSMHVQAVERVNMGNAIRKAIALGEFRILYQPQLASGRIIAMEALIRWQHPELGLITPDRFVPIAEEYGLILPLGEWVLRTACIQNQCWQDLGLPPIPIAVNFSTRQFQDPNLIAKISQILTETGLNPQYLEIEVTESTLTQDKTTAANTLQQLNNLGIHIVIDDFGQGYSSLRHLKKFPVCKIKIDISFVAELPNNQDDAAITTAIIAIAHSLNLKVIAEGVENLDQLEFLRSLKCDGIQGYLFSPPLAAEAATEILTKPEHCL